MTFLRMPHQDEQKKRYAQLIIRFGLNLQKGQNLIIRASIESHDFVQLIAKEAYQAGVKEIFYWRESDELKLLKYQMTPEETIGKYPQWIADGYTEVLKNNCATLYLDGHDPELFKNINPELLQKEQLAAWEARKERLKLVSSYEVNRLIVAVAQLGRAKMLYPQSTDEEAMQQLRNQIFQLVRLDQEDPIQARKTHLKKLNAAADFLNTQHFKALHYEGKGTKLRVELPDQHRWMGAGEKTKSGIEFCPNMPTEEVFTAPHSKGVEGEVSFTRPLLYAGQRIEGAKLTFRAGEVVAYTAEKGEELLGKLLASDPNAKRLGEVAIVPIDSPVYQSGLVFASTLLDENASCHFAFGKAYPSTFLGADKLSPEAKTEAGFNESMIHVDFMVGDESLSITGEKSDGSLIPFFVEGKWNF